MESLDSTNLKWTLVTHSLREREATDIPGSQLCGKVGREGENDIDSASCFGNTDHTAFLVSRTWLIVHVLVD